MARPPRGRLPGVATSRPFAFCATGEPATYPCGRSCRRRRRGVPCRSSATVSRAPSPIERTRRQSVSLRQASSGEVRIKASRDQLATQVEHGSISARANAFGRAAVRADEHGADRSLRELLLAIIFRTPPKLVSYGSPERCDRAGDRLSRQNRGASGYRAVRGRAAARHAQRRSREIRNIRKGKGRPVRACRARPARCKCAFGDFFVGPDCRPGNCWWSGRA